MLETEERIESSSTAARFLIILLVVVALGTGFFLFFMRQQKPLAPEEASVVIKETLKARPMPIVHFHVGAIKPTLDENAATPQYKLLEKAGYMTAKPKGPATTVALTKTGESTLSAVPELKKEANDDGTLGYTVPLAQRELATITKITMNGPNHALVEYSWKWSPNTVGDVFDANGKLIKGMVDWQKFALIQKFGADFYHGEPIKTSMSMVRTDKGWKQQTEF